MPKYSRRAKTQEMKDKRSAFIFFILTIGVLLLFFFFGLPAIARFAAFLTDFRSSTQPVESTDTTPPPPPRLSPLPEATNDQSIEITGSTEPGATVTLSLNGNEEEILANNQGEFTYNFSLNDGENTISASTKDSAGNESHDTTTQTVVYDDDPPDLEVTEPEDGAQFYGSSERQITIRGTTENDAKIIINGRQVVVNNDGSFSYTTTLSEGENEFTIKAEDPARNFTEETITLNFTS